MFGVHPPAAISSLGARQLVQSEPAVTPEPLQGSGQALKIRCPPSQQKQPPRFERAGVEAELRVRQKHLARIAGDEARIEPTPDSVSVLVQELKTLVDGRIRRVHRGQRPDRQSRRYY